MKKVLFAATAALILANPIAAMAAAPEGCVIICMSGGCRCL